ncbi:MAG: hypothetical protein NT157_00980 [Candidatus Micrarchaeota archaeon]|nr:hypothetical protein [Candidatus Micrarchaeota archaeon]
MSEKIFGTGTGAWPETLGGTVLAQTTFEAGSPGSRLGWWYG